MVISFSQQGSLFIPGLFKSQTEFLTKARASSSALSITERSELHRMKCRSLFNSCYLWCMNSIFINERDRWNAFYGVKQPTEVSDVLLSPITSVQWCFTVDLIGQLFSFSSDLFSSAPCFPETHWEAHGENKQRLNAELIKGQSLLKVQGSCFAAFSLLHSLALQMAS